MKFEERYFEAYDGSNIYTSTILDSSKTGRLWFYAGETSLHFLAVDDAVQSSSSNNNNNRPKPEPLSCTQ